ncbi:unnamed protein product [Rodentolepis nana]|uniref:Sugar transporter SWEET1 n=1 Tax=Rodentolepis nana TaxID=102285 RepID=A0A0R3TU61_RODNA|nr:unnamed protein product [Rodentolepis nana]
MSPLVISVLTGIIWGVTNVFMKYAKPIALPVYFLLNQLGSLLFFFNLKDASLSSQVPLSNSLALIVAAITARVFYKEYLNLTSHRHRSTGDADDSGEINDIMAKDHKPPIFTHQRHLIPPAALGYTIKGSFKEIFTSVDFS